MSQNVPQLAPQPPDDDVFVFPTSFAQRRLWFFDQFEPGSAAYNIATAVHWQGALDRQAFSAAINEIVRRHESLRTTFTAIDGEPMQVVAPRLSIEVPFVDVSGEPDETQRRLASGEVADEARRPFDLARGPLIRVRVVCLGPRDYYVLLTVHHIVADGWSMGVLTHELGTLYAAFSARQPSPLAELPIQYADFSEWQREWETSDEPARQIAYWKTQLGGTLPVLRLPTDRVRPAVQTSVGETISARVPRQVLDGAHALARAERATLFNVLVAAFATVLGRYASQDDLCIGTPHANRSRAEIEGLIGCFINTLVLRVSIAGDPTFRELVRRVREVTLGAHANQDVPFEVLVEALAPERSMSFSPIFQVMFILQNAPGRSEELPGLRLTQLESDSGTATFDLTLIASESPAGLDLSIEYNTDLFDRSTMTRLFAHYEQVLRAGISLPETPVSRVDLLPASERRQLLVGWNQTSAAYPVDRLVAGLVEDRALSHPEREAVVCPTRGAREGGALEVERLTYGELNRRANQLADLLRARGVGPEVLVGIAIERSIDVVVAVLAVSKSGGAYVPLDPQYPAERLAFMLQDSGAAIVVTESRHRALFASSPVSLVALDEAATTLAGLDGTQPPLVACDPDETAYVIYTSGSTGQSKGAAVSHRSLLNGYWSWRDAYALTADDRHLQMASFSFDVFGADYVRALCTGSTLVIAPRELMLEPARLYALMRAERVDCAEFVPAVLRVLAQYCEESGQRLDFMRLLVCGSDTWFGEEYARFRALCAPTARVVNSFGLTEATVDSSYYDGGRALGPGQPVPIGRPFANQQLYVLDRHLAPTPIGVPGELFIGGDSLARGYLGRPALTAERFVPSPFADRPGTRLYRTGDLARVLADGNVEFLGRADLQVKVRGFRIELGEIEAALRQHPGVLQAVTVVAPTPSGEQALAAYVVPGDPAAAPDVPSLRRFLQERLPDHFVPTGWTVLDSLPLTPNGKIDRRGLPAPAWTTTERERVAPQGATEVALADIWQAILKVPQIARDDNFFAIGGHSLLATQVVSRIRQTCGVELPLRTIFEAPLLAQLAAEIDRASQAPAADEVPALVRVARTGPLPLSFAQQRLWFLDQLEPGTALYNMPDALRVRGPLDAALFERAVNEIVRRHEALRTTFRDENGQPYQVIAERLSVPLVLVDLHDLPPEAREAEARRVVDEAARRPFDLATGPLLRTMLVRLAPDDHVLLVVVHHIVSDDWSSSVWVEELATLYQAFGAGRRSPLPELPVQYADYAAWQRGWLQGDVLQRQVEYWTRELDGAPPLLTLPTDRPRPAVQTFNGDYVAFAIDERTVRQARELALRQGGTLFMVLLGAFQLLLARYAGQDDVVVGTPIAGRTRRETERLIGFFINTLVMRTRLAGAATFTDVIARVREAALGAYAHQDVPFELLVDRLQPERDLSHTPLFQAMFALQNAPLDLSAGGGPGVLAMAPFAAHSGTAKFDVTMFVTEDDTGLTGALEFNTDLFDRATIERLVRHFTHLLTQVVTAPARPLATVSLADVDERRRLLDDWGTGLRVPSASQPDVVALFEAQVGRTPRAVAVRAEAVTLTYAQLDARANQLARHLRAQGVGRETRVAVLLDRSQHTLVGLLAVLKAGGAYVPLDPAAPQERVAFMIEDAAAALVLTERALVSLVPEGAPRLVIDDAATDVARYEPAALRETIAPEQLAYVIYTSGSTGLPKGAMITHAGLANYLDWCARAYEPGAGMGAAVFSSLSFDLTITGLFAPLLAGREVLMLQEARDVARLSQVLMARGPFSLVKITPAHLQLLGAETPAHRARLCTHRFVIGGENLLPEHVAAWRAHAPKTRLVNEYGPTETVVGCAVFEVPEAWASTAAVPIGRPIVNTRLYVLDRGLQPVPTGVVGELYISGIGVARGYLSRPALTAERFLPDPFAAESGARMYRSGDLARWRADGQLECLGRVDSQVKIRGFRVELGEIEAALCEHPAVSEAVVIVDTPPSGQKRLVAYVVAGAEVETPVLQAALGARLPEYMVPAAWVRLPALPLTVNGKIDRAALPAPGETAAATSFEAPATWAERVLAGVWAQVLNRREVGIHDNFFELGGDSIIAIQAVSRARQAGLTFSPKDLFQHPTIAALSQVATAGRGVEASQEAVSGPVPLTPIAHWFFELERPNPSHYNQSLLFEVRQPIERMTLERTLGVVVEHHDMLRVRASRRDGSWQQHVAPPSPSNPIAWHDLRGCAPEARARALETVVRTTQASLDLERGPALRVAYVDFGPASAGRLLIVVHHLAIDGVSWRILLEDVQSVYDALAHGMTPALPPKTTSFREWALALDRHAAAVPEEALAQWQATVGGALASVPRDFPDGANREALTASVAVSVTQDETRALLEEAPRTLRVDVNDVLLAALARALEPWMSARPLLVDVEGHGREDLAEGIDVSRTVGWFTTLFPVRLDVGGAAWPEGVLARVAGTRQSVPRHGLDYGVLRYLRSDEPARALASAPAAEVAFNYLGQFDGAFGQAGEGLFVVSDEDRGPERDPAGPRRHLVEIDALVSGGVLRAEWTYSTAVHRPETIAAAGERFVAALREILQHVRTGGGPAFSVSDVEAFGWKADDLDAILGAIEGDDE